MHLQRIRAQNFRAFGDGKTAPELDWTLSPGLNILIGENDAGKTAVVELEAAFQLSRGPALALNLALMAVERKLQEAWSWMPQVDSPMPGDEDVAESIRKRALDLREAIKSKRSEGLE